MRNSEIGEITVGSGNIFADLGLENPEEELAKAKLAYAISNIIKERGLTQAEAASVLGTDQARVSEIKNGRISGMTYDRLIKFLRALNYTLSFEVVPIAAEAGRESPIGKDLASVTISK